MKSVSLTISAEEGVLARLEVDATETLEEMKRGLGGRPVIGVDEGMIFSFPQARMVEFSMRGMETGLDFLFIRAGEIVQVAEAVAAGFAGRIASKVAVEAVLELGAGACAAWGIAEGARISIDV